MSDFASSSAERLVLVRVCGGATYHTVFTFKDRIFAFADAVRERLTRASIDPLWPAAGFEIVAAEEDILIGHYDQPQWFVRIGERDVYFQHDAPDVATIGSLARVAGFLIDVVVDLLRMPSPRTVGTKFDVLMTFSRWSEIQEGINLSTIQREEDDREHVEYCVGPWQASVTMVEPRVGVYLCDLDFFCRDSYLIPGEYVTFFSTAWGHLTEDLLPFVTHTEFGRQLAIDGHG